MGKSLEEVNESVSTLDKKSAFRKILAFWSIYLISVGWIPETGRLILQEEPVWYSLLWVLLMSNIMALLLQSLSARLGIVTQRDLAQASRETIRHLSITFFIF
jgi:manganese transport protein